MSRRFWLFGFAIAATLLAGGAHAQCPPDTPPGARIYVDPRLVPKRIPVTQLQIVQSQVDPWTSTDEKMRLVNQYWLQFRPIEIPYGHGRLLISPINPCIQEYLGR